MTQHRKTSLLYRYALATLVTLALVLLFDPRGYAGAPLQPTMRPASTTRPIPTPTREAPTAIPPAATPTPISPAGTTGRPIIVHGRAYEAYIPAATKRGQAYKFSCEFDAAWVILKTFGYDTRVDDLIAAVGVERGAEPFFAETRAGVMIYGGDVTAGFSGDYRANFLARSTGTALRKAFERYGLQVTPVHDRAGVETALRSGALVWMKTTVDFKPWRPATWVLPDGRTRRTVLGNDHAVVVIGFDAERVVIRDVLGPTSSNPHRSDEYEVGWPTFLAVWEAQEFDGLAVAPPPTR